MEATLQDLDDVMIYVFEPSDVPRSQLAAPNGKIPQMTAGRAALIELIQQYLRGLLDPHVTLLEVHKLLYFLQEGGEPLRLNYAKASYGPFAENLRHVLNHVEGYFISGYADGGDKPTKELQLVPGAVKDAERFLEKHPQTSENIKKVCALVEGFESAFGLELLATVHWLIVKENIKSLNEIIRHTHSWNERKKQFSPRQIEIAVKRLINQGWVRGITGLKCP